jgi:MFS family permease
MSYFRSSNQASWLSTAFLLTSTAIQPVVGRLSDTIGRKPPYLFAMTVFPENTSAIFLPIMERFWHDLRYGRAHEPTAFLCHLHRESVRL